MVMLRRHRYILVASFLAIVVAAAILGVWSRQQLLDSLVVVGDKNSLDWTSALSTMAGDQIAEFLRDPIRSKISALDRKIRELAAEFPVLKVKIYDLDGHTLYSTDTGEIGKDQSANRGLQAARRGESTGLLVYKDTFNAFDRTIENSDLIETYIPFRAQPGGPVLAVFEVYTDVTPLVGEIKRTQFITWGGVATVLLGLYSILVVVVLRSEKVMDTQSRALAQTANELDRSESLVDSLFNSTHEPSIIVDGDGIIVRANAGAEQFLGRRLPGSNFQDVVRQSWRSRDERRTPEGVVERILKHNKPVWGRQIRVGIDEPRLLSVDGYPVAGEHAGQELIILTFRDITQETELRTRLVRQEKLMSFATLAAAFAHEIGNPLASLTSELEMAQRDNRSEELKQSLTTMGKLADRIAMSLHKLRSSFREEDLQPVEVSIPAAVASAVRMVRERVNARSIDLVTEFDEGLPNLYMAREHLVLILGNLLNNAVDAMPDGGKVQVLGATTPNGDVELIVRDSGRGMDAETRRRAVEPLYTTNQQGTGLGLAISQEIMRTVEGGLEIHSEPGHGTTISLRFTGSHIAASHARESEGVDSGNAQRKVGNTAKKSSFPDWHRPVSES